MSNITGTSGADRLVGSLNADNFAGMSASDTILGSDGNDVIAGGTGNDFLNGNRNNDTLFGQEGDDTLRGGKDDDYLHGGDITITSGDNDLLYGDLGNDVLLGNRNNDILYGGEGNDSLRGGKNEDALNGLLGNDTLNGDLGNDTLTGNEGIDRFVVAIDAGSTDIINDLHGDGIEQVDLTAFTAITSFDQLVIANVGNDAHIDLGNSQTLILKNHANTTLTTDDFIFATGGGGGGGTNNPPTIAAWDATPTYNQGNPAVTIDNNVTLSDSDDTQLQTVTVQVLNALNTTDEVLAATDSGGVTSSYNTGNNTLTLTGPAAVSAFQTVLRTVTYINNAGSVTTGTRTVNVIASDAQSSSQTVSTTMTVNSNSLPVVAGWNATPTYTEGNAPLTVDNDVTITDANDANLTSVTIQITNDADGANEVLAATDSGGVTSSFAAGSHTLTLSGAATVGAYQTVLRTVTYINNSQDPTAGGRTLQVIANDGKGTSTPVSTSVTVAAVNDDPVNTVPPNTLTTNVDTNLVVTGVSIADVDDTTMDTVTLTVTNGTLTVSTAVGGGVTGGQVSNNGTASVTITGATVTALNATFADAAGLIFAPTASYAGPATFTIASDDGDATDTDLVNISVISASMSLGNLDGVDGFRITGRDASDRLGNGVGYGGDINNDGFDDILLAARLAGGGGTERGEAYVIFGKSTSYGSNVNVSSLDGADGFRLDGITNDDQLSGAGRTGDVNADGFDDLIIGSGGEPAGGNQNGETYVVFGKGTAFSAIEALSALDGTDGFRLEGEGNQDNAVGGDSAGDFNGDGYDDILIGAAEFFDGSQAGQAHLFYGKASGYAATFGIGGLDGTDGFKLDGINNDDDTARMEDISGDINGDGYADIVIGASEAEDSGGNAEGEVHVMFGTNALQSASFSIGNLDGTDGFRLTGIDAADGLSRYGLSANGDVNGDGFDDLLVSARVAEPTGGSSEGESYIIFGKASGWASNTNVGSLDGTDGFRLTGTDASDLLGRSGDIVGDVNGDGYDDIVVGAEEAEPAGGDGEGEVYIIFGKGTAFASNIDVSALDGTDGFRFVGIDANDAAGWEVSASGDINGDGFEDFIIAANTAEPTAGSDEGEAYLIYGRDFNGVVTHNGTSSADSITGTAGVNNIVGMAGADTLDGGGGADVLIGGGGNDVLIYDSSDLKIRGDRGTDTLRLQSGDALDLTALANNRTVSIEVIDALTDTSANTLTINYLDALNISPHTNQLTIDGNASDTLTFDVQGRSFTQGSSGGYTTYDFGGFLLRVDEDIGGSVATQTIELANLDGADGFRLTGTSNGDEAGDEVNAAGDVNGDGFEDIIVGAGPGDEAYVIFGKASGFASNIILSSLDGSDGFRMSGITASDVFGGSVSAAGDVNGDGFDDVIVGAPFANVGGAGDRGQIFIVFGKGTAFTSNIDMSDLDGTDGYRLDGEDTAGSAGNSVSFAGDINGDGYDDVLLGASRNIGGTDQGRSYVYFGKNSFSAINGLSGVDGTDGFKIVGIDSDDQSGAFVSGLGDINGDGYDELFIGALEAEPAAGDREGESYVIYGKGTSFTDINLSALDGTDGFRLTGIDAIDRVGTVSNAGDVNNDGLDDLLIGAFSAEPAAASAVGETYVVFGKASSYGSNFDLGVLDGTDGFRLIGLDVNDEAGAAVGAAGDFNGDGFGDIIIGARYALDSNRGEAYIVYGKASGFASAIELSALDGTDGFRLPGVDAGDKAGRFAKGAGDVDGDGFDDVIIGARDGEPAVGGSNDTGESYVVFGGNFDDAVTNTGTGSGETINGGATADKIDGDAGNDNITGAAGVDTLIGGQGDDTLDGGTGADVLIGGSGDDTFIFEATDTVIQGGRGTDVLTLTGISTANLAGINTFEGIETITSDNTAITLTLPKMNGVTATTGTGADTITLGNGRQTINAGAGADTVNSGNGSDTINLGATDTAADRVRYDDANDGAAEGSFNYGHDSITQFEIGTDQVQFGGVFNGGTTDLDDITADDNFTFASDAAANFTTTHEGIFRTGLADADFTELGFSTIRTNLNTLGITATSGDDALIVIQAATQTGIFYYVENGGLDNDIGAVELTLLGVSNGQLTTAEFDFY